MPLGRDIQGLRFSKEDADLFSVCFEVGKNGYAFRTWIVNGKRNREYAHSMIAKRVWGRAGKRDLSEVVEHWDRDKLNCSRENLRLVSQRVNIFNSAKYDVDFGVTWNAHRGKWRTRVSMGGKIHYLGNYFDKADAQKVVKEFISTKEYRDYISGL